MKFFATSSPAIVSGDMPSSIMGMDAKGMKMACMIMRDRIYTDKIGGIIREYAANALDEHVKFNINQPVELRLFRDENRDTMFSVRDFAYGLDEDSIRNVFAMYFKSTKSESNDSIGGFGVGGKIWNAYTDSFYVTSHFEGVKTVYCCNLSADADGTSVGIVYKVGDEPTTESGIEVVGEVKPEDVLRFSEAAEKFVRFCSKPIVFHNDLNSSERVTTVPTDPTHTVTKNGYVFKFFKVYDVHPKIGYRMGDVTYKTIPWSDINTLATTIDCLHVCVEIPIGKMSLPISREQFEETAGNHRILEDIDATLRSMIEEDLAPFKNKTFMELLATKNESAVQGTLFHALKSKFYPDLYPVVGRLQRTNLSLSPEKYKDKYLVAIIPDKRTSGEWTQRLVDAAIRQNKSFYYFDEASLSYINRNQEVVQALRDNFDFFKIRSRHFGIISSSSDKLDRNLSAFDQRYNARPPSIRYRRSKSIAYKPLDLYNAARHRVNLPIAESIEEAQDQMDNLDIKDFETLKWLTVEQSTTANDCWTTVSKKMYEALVSLGMLTYHSEDYNRIYKEIHDENQRQKNISENITNAVPQFLDYEYQTNLRARLQNRPKYAERMSKVWNGIIEEPTLRGSIIKNMRHVSYYQLSRISRNDLRKILQLR